MEQAGIRRSGQLEVFEAHIVETFEARRRGRQKSFVGSGGPEAI
jgi:hypothetical protein